jgi:hypothetical protein
MSRKNVFSIGKESLNSDGNQFHQYQQNEQSPLILTEPTEHKYHVVNAGLDLGNVLLSHPRVETRISHTA